METLLLIFQAILLFVVFVVAIYNWLYFIQTNKVEQKLGITLPQAVKSMLFVNLFIPIAALGALVLFLLGNILIPQ